MDSKYTKICLVDLGQGRIILVIPAFRWLHVHPLAESQQQVTPDSELQTGGHGIFNTPCIRAPKRRAINDLKTTQTVPDTRL
jgi:hypothetical protein